MSRVTLQVYSRYPGSLYRCIHDIQGHFTGVFTISRVTLQVYLRCPGSLYRYIHDIPGHWCEFDCGVTQNGVNLPVV